MRVCAFLVVFTFISCASNDTRVKDNALFYCTAYTNAKAIDCLEIIPATDTLLNKRMMVIKCLEFQQESLNYCITSALRS